MPCSGRRFGFSPIGEHENSYHGEEIKYGLPQRPYTLWVGHGYLCCGLLRLFLSEKEMHKEPDDDAESDGTSGACNPHFQAQNAGRHDNGQNIDGRTGIKEGRGRAYARAHAVNTGEKRQNRAGANSQYGSGYGSHTIGKHPVGFGAQILHDRGLAHKNPDSSGNKKSGYKTEQHMLPSIPFYKIKRLEHGAIKTRRADREKKDPQKDGGNPENRF